MRKPERSGSTDHLYAIESSCGHVKLGRAHDVGVRLKSLQGSCPPSVRLTLIAVADNHGDWEDHMHSVFDEHHVRGEWFSGAVAVRLRELLSRGSFAMVVRALAATLDEETQELCNEKARRAQMRRSRAK